MGNIPDKKVSLVEFMRDRKLKKAGKRKDGALMAIAQKWAQANRPGLASAFIKSMRMQKINQTLYWGSLMYLGGLSDWYIARRAMVSACEDGCDPEVMEYTASVFMRHAKHRGAIEVLKSALAVCHAKNWWNCAYGRGGMRGIFATKKKEKIRSTDVKTMLEMLEGSLHNSYDGFIS